MAVLTPADQYKVLFSGQYRQAISHGHGRCEAVWSIKDHWCGIEPCKIRARYNLLSSLLKTTIWHIVLDFILTLYVLEGVTPCIQSMQLHARDTVTFSRIDLEGKLVMGFRKATNVAAQD